MSPPVAPAEGAAGAPPPVELTPEQKKIQDQIDKMKAGNPDAIKEMADFQVRQADEDNAKLQERYRTALVNAANAYHQELLKVPGGDPLKAVNEAFAPAGVRFELGADGKLAMAAGAPESKKEKGRELTDEEKNAIQEAFSSNPKLAAGAERLMASMAEGSPELEVAQGFFDNFNALSPKEKQAILTNDQAFQKFLKTLPNEQQKFVNQLRQTAVEVSNELSDEERENIVDGARKELEKFDVTKATEIDKNIVLARMQMRGIDTSNPDAIFKKPPELKVFDGSPMERGFNQIMGLIGYVLLSIEKMKGALKPKEKSAGAPAGDKGKTGPEARAEASPAETELKKQAKEKGMLQARLERQNEIDQNKKLLDGDPAAADGSDARLGLRGREVALTTKDAQLKAKSEQLDAQLKGIDKTAEPADYAAKEREISDIKTEREKIAVDLKGIQEQKTKAEARITQLTTETKSLEDIQKRTEALRQKIRDTQTEMKSALAVPPIAERGEAKAILAALKGIRIISPAQADERFTIELWGDPDPNVDLAKFSAGADAVKKLGGNSVAWDLEAGKTLKDPEAFDASLRKALDTLKTKPAVAPAGPAAA